MSNVGHRQKIELLSLLQAPEKQCLHWLTDKQHKKTKDVLSSEWLEKMFNLWHSSFQQFAFTVLTFLWWCRHPNANVFLWSQLVYCLFSLTGFWRDSQTRKKKNSNWHPAMCQRCCLSLFSNAMINFGWRLHAFVFKKQWHFLLVKWSWGSSVNTDNADTETELGCVCLLDVGQSVICFLLKRSTTNLTTLANHDWMKGRGCMDESQHNLAWSAPINSTNAASQFFASLVDRP